ncbi:hypothetical protein [Halococcus sediminicola]|uniref:hypothetical protein n=1 Tax=Halococcus sediminicola TaxID=1264579 RepID=UPI000678EA3A|nr:hypothetical protein [Halococcus sediminicola]
MARTPAENIDVLRDRIRTSEDITDDDIEVLIKFSHQLFLLATEYSDHRHEKLLCHCTRMAEEVGGLADALDERNAAEDIVRWINRTYDNEETNRDYRVAPETTHDSEHPPESNRVGVGPDLAQLRPWCSIRRYPPLERSYPAAH